MSTTSALYRMWEELHGPASPRAPRGQWLHDLVARIAREEGEHVKPAEAMLTTLIREFDHPFTFVLGGLYTADTEIVKTAGSWEIRTNVELRLPHFEATVVDARALLDMARVDTGKVEDAIRTQIVDGHFKPLQERVRVAGDAATREWLTALGREVGNGG